MSAFDPWDVVARRPELDVQWEARPGLLGSFEPDTSVIKLHPRQSQAQRRCTLAHELVHAERGDGDCDPRTEDLVHREAARRLIGLEALVQAVLFYGEDLGQLAEALWVDQETLMARVNHLHPSERGYLNRRLSMREASA